MNSSNPFVTNPQTMGTIDRVMIAWATLASAKLLAVLGIDPGYTDWLAAGMLSAVAGIIGWAQNRPSLIAATVANMGREQLSSPDVAKSVVEAAGQVANPSARDGKTVVIASPALAAATTESPNVVSSTRHRVVEQ